MTGDSVRDDPVQGDSTPESEADLGKQRRTVEGLLFASPEPLSAKRLSQLVPDCNPEAIRTHIRVLNEEYEGQDRAFRVERVAGGYQLRTAADLAPALRALRPVVPLRLSRAALETLAIAAYRQPITRAEVDNIRGVDAGPLLRTLLERKLLRVAGHREVPGRPLLYATSRRFLEIFGLHSLTDLPTLREIDAWQEGSDAAQEGESIAQQPSFFPDVAPGAAAENGAAAQSVDEGDATSETAVPEGAAASEDTAAESGATDEGSAASESSAGEVAAAPDSTDMAPEEDSVAVAADVDGSATRSPAESSLAAERAAAENFLENPRAAEPRAEESSSAESADREIPAAELPGEDLSTATAAGGGEGRGPAEPGAPTAVVSATDAEGLEPTGEERGRGRGLSTTAWRDD